MNTHASTRRLAALAASAAFMICGWGLLPSSALAVDAIPFACNGTSGSPCSVFQLDGSTAPTAHADTCVGTENGCPSEQNPVWPADWDALLYPSLTSATPAIQPLTGSPPGAWTFSLPWGGFGSFSGIFTSTLVSTGTSTILKSGSKNGGDISTWVVASQSSPPKDAYLAGALASYSAPPVAPYTGHELLYFGSTRFSSSGSATVGIWFFKENVQVCSSGPNAGKAMCVGTTTTLAEHKVGDAFLFLTFGGSGIATIQAATWQGADGPAGFLGPAPGSLVVCPSTNADVCAVSNADTSFTTTLGSPTGPQLPGFGFNVSGPGFAGFAGGIVPTLQFEEGGIDLNSVFAGTPPCFSSVMFASVSSGSSPSTAALKSILLGSFNTCAISATKSCGNASPNIANGTVTYTISGQVQNTGGGSVQGLSIADTFNGNGQTITGLACTCGPTGCSITGSDCSTALVQPGGTVNYSASITTSANGGSDKVTATMGGTGGGSASATSNIATCPSVTLSDSIAITKTCNSSLVSTSCGLTVQVGAGGNVTNTSSQLTLSNVTVYDCRGGTFTSVGNPSSCSSGAPTTIPIGMLGAGASAPYTDTYNPTVLPSDAFSNTCPNGTFSDTVLVVGQCTSVFCQSGTVFNTKTASCPLCPLH